MSLTLESKARINALIAAANAKTGGSAADLTTAVQTLVGFDKDYLAQVWNKEITELINDKMTGTLYAGFQTGNTNLIKIDLPNITTVAGSCFSYCSNLTTVNLPSATVIDGGAFEGCPFEYVYFPALTTLDSWGYTFCVCRGLKKAVFPKLVSINCNEFENCNQLETLILGADAVCTMKDSNCLNYSGIAAGIGYIYVPSAHIEDYKAATNWAVYADRFRAIEDYPDICWEVAT